MATKKAYNVEIGFAERTKDGKVVFFSRHNAHEIPEVLSAAKIAKHLDGPAPSISAYDEELGNPLDTVTGDEPITEASDAKATTKKGR